MVHRVSHKKLSRTTKQRTSLIRNLANSLILHERIVTTLARAKTAQPFIEKLITKSKEDTLINRRYLISNISGDNSVRKMLDLIGPIFKERKGGYTRIVKIAPRVGDRAKMAILEFVEKISEVAVKKKIDGKKPKTIKIEEAKNKKEIKPKAKKLKLHSRNKIEVDKEKGVKK